MTPRIAICLTSHDRLDCTRINQEVFRLNFAQPYLVIHASSGPKAAPYLEDAFVLCRPRPHYAGAMALMHSALQAALPFEPDFLVLLDGDTWLLDEVVLQGLIGRLQADAALLMATCSWMPLPPSTMDRLARELSEIREVSADRVRRLAAIPRRLAYDAVEFSTQFCILRNRRCLIELFCGMNIEDPRRPERQWFDRFSARFSLRRVMRMKEREPVHPRNRFVCEPLGLFCQHWPAAGTSTGPTDETDFHFVRADAPGKREAILHHPHIRKGDSIQRLLNATSIADLAYYNAGARRH